MPEFKYKPPPLKNCMRCRRMPRVVRDDGSTWQVCLKCFWATGSTTVVLPSFCPRCERVGTEDMALCQACESEITAQLRDRDKVIYT